MKKNKNKIIKKSADFDLFEILFIVSFIPIAFRVNSCYISTSVKLLEYFLSDCKEF